MSLERSKSILRNLPDFAMKCQSMRQLSLRKKPKTPRDIWTRRYSSMMSSHK